MYYIIRTLENKSSAVAEMSDSLATIDTGRPFRGGPGSPCNTMSPGLRSTSVPSGILIHPAVWQ